MGNNIRFPEAKVQLTVDGKRYGDSLTVTDWEISPRAELQYTRSAGEARDINDLDIAGYTFKFSAQTNDRTWFDLWKKFDRAQKNGDAMPVVSFSVTENYRGTPAPNALTLVCHGDTMLMIDSRSGPGGADYLKTSWSGACQEMDGA